MIAMIQGRILAVAVDSLVVATSGVGFSLLVPPPLLARAVVGQEITLHTSLVVREDSLTLYGFSTRAELDEFTLVQSASRIGPKLALAVVSTLEPQEFLRAISEQDVLSLTRVPGIGKKAAEKMILELKDKVGVIATPTSPSGSWKQQVLSGLTNLGFSTNDALDAIADIAPLAEDSSVSVGRLLQAALQVLGGRL